MSVRDEDRQRMQMSQGRKRDNISEMRQQF